MTPTPEEIAQEVFNNPSFHVPTYYEKAFVSKIAAVIQAERENAKALAIPAEPQTAAELLGASLAKCQEQLANDRDTQKELLDALKEIEKASRGVPNQLGCDSFGNCTLLNCRCSNHIARAAIDAAKAESAWDKTKLK